MGDEGGWKMGKVMKVSFVGELGLVGVGVIWVLAEFSLVGGQRLYYWKWLRETTVSN
jgi:hypothetical protein